MRRQLLTWCVSLLCVGFFWHGAEGRSLLVAAETRQGTFRGQLPVIQGEDGVSYVSLDRLGRRLEPQGPPAPKARAGPPQGGGSSKAEGVGRGGGGGGGRPVQAAAGRRRPGRPPVPVVSLLHARRARS